MDWLNSHTSVQRRSDPCGQATLNGCANWRARGLLPGPAVTSLLRRSCAHQPEPLIDLSIGIDLGIQCPISLKVVEAHVHAFDAIAVPITDMY